MQLIATRCDLVELRGPGRPGAPAGAGGLVELVRQLVPVFVCGYKHGAWCLYVDANQVRSWALGAGRRPGAASHGPRGLARKWALTGGGPQNGPLPGWRWLRPGFALSKTCQTVLTRGVHKRPPLFHNRKAAKIFANFKRNRPAHDP